jgi:short-chain fatty acids transporter
MKAPNLVTSPAGVDLGAQPARATAMQRAVGNCVYLFERLMPDPFVLVIILTVLTVIAAVAFAPHASPTEMLNGWYKGIFNIFTFAFQMVLILSTGHALASAGVIRAFLKRVGALAAGPNSAVLLVFMISAIASFLNWGFGLVIGAMIAKEVARHVKVDFAWLVAAAYSAWTAWTFTGLSSSIALSIASPGNPLNLIELQTHAVTPLSQTIFTAWNLAPGILSMVLIPIVFILMRPADADVIPADNARLQAEEAALAIPVRRDTFAAKLEGSPILTFILVASGFAYLAVQWSEHGVNLDINTVIFIFLMSGLALHGRPANYVAAISNAAKVTGPLLLQFPFYGGIMGLMTATGLAGVIAAWYIEFSTANTLPFFSYLASCVITLFIPSGGGHWAVQGPFTIPAAVSLGASLPGTSMAIASGELAGALLQPFWVVPLVAIAGVGVQRVLGFTLTIFFVLGTLYGLSYLFLVPAMTAQ